MIKYSLTFVLLLNLIACNKTTQSQNQEPLVLSPTAFEQKIKDLPNEQILDVRTSEEIAKGQIPNAISVDFNAPTFQKEVLSKVEKSKPVLIYCHSGRRSKEAADFLRTEGYQVYELEGGIAKWQAENKEIANAKIVMKLADFRTKIAGDKAVLVDFSAVWCKPCQEMKPSIEKLTVEMQKDFDIITVDVDDSEDIATAFEIQAMPTLLLFKSSKIIWKKVGYTEEKELREVLNSFK
jgi:thioredoxin